jgi:hypothetical protein
MFDLAKQYQAGGSFGNDYIQINSLPETALKVLKELKIKFQKLSSK